MRIIINADDLGYNQTITKAIYLYLNKGLITSATLMALGEAYEEGVKATREFPQYSFGIHLCLSEFKPLSDSEIFYENGMLNEQGHFISANLHRRYTSAKLQKAIFAEWRMQCQKVFDSGVPVSHFDSHHSIHTFSDLAPVVGKLMDQFKVSRLRGRENIYPQNLKLLKKFYRKAKTKYWAFKLGRKSIHTDYFSGFDAFLKHGRNYAFKESTTLELMVHPGYTTPPFVIENQRIEAKDWTGIFPQKIKLITYRELNG